MHSIRLGDGYIASSLHKEYSKFIVLEGSHQIIQNCKDANVQYEVVETLFENFQTTHKFDILLGNHVLEHVDDPIFTLSHVRQFLKPHGKALFTVPNADSLHRKIGVELGLIVHAQELSDRDRLLGHRRVYTIDELTGHIISAGFNISDTFGYNIKIVSFAQMNDWSNDLHQAIFKISLNLPPSICSNIAILCNA